MCSHLDIVIDHQDTSYLEHLCLKQLYVYMLWFFHFPLCRTLEHNNTSYVLITAFPKQFFNYPDSVATNRLDFPFIWPNSWKTSNQSRKSRNQGEIKKTIKKQRKQQKSRKQCLCECRHSQQVISKGFNEMSIQRHDTYNDWGFVADHHIMLSTDSFTYK